jgi:hypothetical protein
VSTEYLASALVEAVRQEGLLPEADSNASTARLLAVMNREQRLYLTRLLLSAREEYQTDFVDVPLSPGVLRYAIPGRAVAATVKQVDVVGADGALTPLLPVSRGRRYDTEAYSGPGDYHFERSHLVFLRAPSASTARISFHRRLNRIVAAEEAGQVASLDANAGTVTLAGSSAPTGFTASGASYDFIQGSPHFDVLGVDASATRSGQVLAFSGGLPSELAVGDWVALAGQTPICNAPLELHDVLVYLAVTVHLQARGDPKWQAAAQLLEQARENALSLIQPRATDSNTPLVNYNAPGWNHVRRSGRRRLL